MRWIVVLGAVVIIFVSAAYYINIKNNKTVDFGIVPEPVITQAVGGDRDVNGCIGSAGYMWCEPKNKCLRIWEESCYKDVSQEIQYLLAKKYNKTASEVKITLTKQEENFVSGSVLFGQGGPGEGGVFLARKAGNLWEVVYDGNGSIDCIKMRQEYKFPDTLLKPNYCD